jgi:hypothetical protein
MHAVAAAPDLVGEGRLGNGQGIGVRHFEHGGDPAHHGAARSRLQIFLLGLARLAEMHLGVDHAGQDVQALAVDHLAAVACPEAADRRDPATTDADIANTLAVLIDHGAGF